MMIQKVGFALRLVLSPFFTSKEIPVLSFDAMGQDAQKLLYNLLQSNDPCMIARFGSVELQAVVDYMCRPSLKNIYKYCTKQIDYLGYGKSHIFAMSNNAGFFPSDAKSLDRFAEMMIDSMQSVDVLGSWQANESYFDKELNHCKKIPLADLEPYYFESNWMPVLDGKKVLVIHPFAKSIISQYENNYSHLFENKQMSPSYELQVLKAVQSLGGEADGFSTWFEALDFMKDEIASRNFDIAIIGCGAYGFPLAEFVKKLGKKSIHLGGAVQYLFGIRSTAIDNNPNLSHLINEWWVRPLEEERPRNYQHVENSRYW